MGDEGSEHDWYLRAWLETQKMRQIDLVERTGWGKSKVSELVNGVWHYNREIINTVAKALRIEPFELLMHPDEAMAIRRLRDNALRIAAERRMPYRGEGEH